jgi:hypothetical protein
VYLSKQNQEAVMRTKTYLTIEQLEGMKTHELADLLGNIALLLRRMPDVVCGELMQPIPNYDVFITVEVPQRTSSPILQFTEVELRKKKKEELQKIAKDLFILCTNKTLKDELISKILTRAASGRSEQFAIQDV